MAVAYFALKLLKRNRRNQGKHQLEKQRNNFADFSSDFDGICRICLKKATIPIYEASSQSDIAKFISIFGDIQIDAADKLPKHLCEACYYLLQSAIIFRKSAQESNEILHQKLSEAIIADTSVDEVISDDNLNEIVNNEPETPKYTCKLCKLSFDTNADYVAHKTSKQHKKVRIQCTICHRLLTANLYKRHQARHDSASHLICEVCGKLFRKDNLIRHLQLHSFELPYQCNVCPYRGRYVEALKIHKRTHTGDKPFSCNKCNLRFLTRSNLNRHLLTHRKERPFQCQECERGFYTKKDLDAHFKSDHIGLKEFGCQACGNKYGTRKALMRHELRVHKRNKMAKGRLPLYLQAEYRK